MKVHMIRAYVLVAALGVAVFLSSAKPVFAQGPAGFPDLVGALKSTPGCLGVETAETASDKQVIFAWFENKKAVLNWYYNDTHQHAMRMFMPGRSSGRVPLSEIADESGPIMVIASLTLTDKPRSDGVSLPVSQIAIELYGPLPGGLAVGGRFAPSAVKVRGLLEPTAPARSAEPK